MVDLKKIKAQLDRIIELLDVIASKTEGFQETSQGSKEDLLDWLIETLDLMKVVFTELVASERLIAELELLRNKVDGEMQTLTTSNIINFDTYSNFISFIDDVRPVIIKLRSNLDLYKSFASLSELRQLVKDWEIGKKVDSLLRKRA